MSLTEQLQSGKITPDEVIKLIEQSSSVHRMQYEREHSVIEKLSKEGSLITLLKEPVDSGRRIVVTVLKSEKVPETIGGRIKKSREDAGITFNDMCGKFSSSPGSYRDYENEDWCSVDDFEAFSMDMFLDIARVLNCSLDYLITGTDSFKKEL